MSLVFFGMTAMLGGNPALAGDAFWEALQPLCGKAFEGELVRGTDPSDADIGEERLVMHVRECGEEEIRIPFHVGENRSRTWILTRNKDGVRLKHDHRHEDGSEDEVTQYGGDTTSSDGLSLDFAADDFTAKMLPAAATNIWTMSIVPGEHFTYQLRREEQGRYFTVEFDLEREIEPPPAPWGH